MNSLRHCWFRQCLRVAACVAGMLWTGALRGEEPVAACPDVVLTVTEEFANQIVARETVNAGPVKDCLLGADVTGQQTTLATTRLDVLPSGGTARFEFVLDGRTQNNTVGVTPQAAVRTRGDHRFELRKQIDFDGRCLTTRSPSAIVSPAYRNESAMTPVGGVPLVGPLATQVVLAAAEQRRPQAYQVIARRITEDAAPRFNDGIDEQLVLGNRRLAEWNARLAEWGCQPARHFLSSSEMHLTWGALFSTGAYRSPPADGAKGTIQIHESAINALLDRAPLAGLEFRDTELDQILTNLLDGLMGSPPATPRGESPATGETVLRAPALELAPPAAIPLDIGAGLATIVLSRERPLRVAFGEGRIELIVRAAFRPALGPEIPEQVVTIAFAVATDAEQIRIVPEPPVIAPADPAAAVGALDAIAQTILQQQIAQRLQPVNLRRAYVLPLGESEPVTVTIRAATLSNGWLSIPCD